MPYWCYRGGVAWLLLVGVVVELVVQVVVVQEDTEQEQGFL
jgi:hypothetical protein